MTNWDVVHDLRDRIVLLQFALHERENEIKTYKFKIGKLVEEIAKLKPYAEIVPK